MVLRNVSILKAKAGEFKALLNVSEDIASRLLPLFEIGRLTDDMRKRKYLATSSAPTATYLDRVADGIYGAWGEKPAMVDGYFWKPDSLTENGDHVMAYVINRLEERGVPIIPIVGYDRCENKTYHAAMKGILAGKVSYCLRLDHDAADDAAEPEFFKANITKILEGLDLYPAQCSVLIDFGDSTNTGINELVENATRIIEQLYEFGFSYFVTSACSIPKSIELAVAKPDTTSTLIRREMLLWKALREAFADIRILYGDYGVRGPTTNDEIRSKYTNGKIRYTIDQQTLVFRGHPFVNDHSATQMYGLAAKIVQSHHYVGEEFSWGDKQIKACSLKTLLGSPGDWIAIDTNHHLTYAVQEVEEFEQSVVVAKAEAKS